MLVEDRELAYLFLDPDNAPPEAQPFDLSLAPGVVFSDIEDDEKVVWLASDTTLRVVPRASVDFDNDPFDKEFPIPSCVLCLGVQDYEALIAL